MLRDCTYEMKLQWDLNMLKFDRLLPTISHCSGQMLKTESSQLGCLIQKSDSINSTHLTVSLDSVVFNSLVLFLNFGQSTGHVLHIMSRVWPHNKVCRFSLLMPEHMRSATQLWGPSSSFTSSPPPAPHYHCLAI